MIHARLINIIRYLDDPPRVIMTFENIDNPGTKFIHIDIYSLLRSKRITINQKFVNGIQNKLQGQKFIINDDNTVFQLLERIQDCRS